jgi:predicted metal-dependent hydrolase
MQLEFLFRPGRTRLAQHLHLTVGERQVPLLLVRNRRARRYVLRLRPDGTARVAIPRGGSAEEARRFVEKSTPWLERQILRQEAESSRPREWVVGNEILFRGELARLEVDAPGQNILFGGESVRLNSASDLRPAVERHLRQLAARELPKRVLELAAQHKLPVKRVMVRSQRSRWGSCSRSGTISLNWRLVQTPVFVRDYIIWHELAHLKEMNHSNRFWKEVERLCPDYAEAERWLKVKGRGFLL